MERSVCSQFELMARSAPDRIAVVFEDERLTYHDLDVRSASIAADLIKRGAGPNAVVAVSSVPSTELVAAVWGVLRAGAAYVPLDPSHPVRWQRQRLETVDAVAVVAGPGARDDVVTEDRVLDLSKHRTTTADDAVAAPAGDDLAYVIFTSGSTGQPKGVMIDHAALANRITWMQRAYPIGRSDVVLHKTPFTFDVSVWELVWPLTVGATMCVARPGGHIDPAYLTKVMAHEKVTVCHFVPSMLTTFLRDGQIEDCTSLRHLICSGEALPVDVAHEARQRSTASIHNLYGPTEAAIDVTAYDVTGHEHGYIPIGTAIDRMCAEVIIDDRYADVAEAGELHLSGVGLARGYVGDPILTEQAFPTLHVDGDQRRWYRTGDLAMRLPDGNLVYMGRRDEQVKVRGVRLEPAEIEVVIRSVHGITDAACVVVGEHDDARLAACVVIGANDEDGRSDDDVIDLVRRTLLDELPATHVPVHFVSVPALPTSRHGKLDRTALISSVEAWLQRRHEQHGAGTLADELVDDIRSTFAAILDVPDVAANADFFEAGGQSVRAMEAGQVLSDAFRVRFGVSLSPLALYRYPTAETLAAHVRELMPA